MLPFKKNLSHFQEHKNTAYLCQMLYSSMPDEHNVIDILVESFSFNHKRVIFDDFNQLKTKQNSQTLMLKVN